MSLRLDVRRTTWARAEGEITLVPLSLKFAMVNVHFGVRLFLILESLRGNVSLSSDVEAYVVRGRQLGV